MNLDKNDTYIHYRQGNELLMDLYVSEWLVGLLCRWLEIVYVLYCCLKGQFT